MLMDLDLDKLVSIFPPGLQKSIKNHKHKRELTEIVMDLGRRPEGRFFFGWEYLAEEVVSWQDIDQASKRLGSFQKDNRAGIEGSLHRISCLRNRKGSIIGFSARLGRSVVGSLTMIRDVLEVDQSFLFLGKPGLGKTTFIREMSRIFSEEGEKRVVIVDTANEIGGENDQPHVGIGRARRLQASSFEDQHRVMIEAVENHMPEVVVVDEIGSEAEAEAARSIAERGVQLIGTAHGNSLESLIKNPSLCSLIGGIHSVTLSDEEARKRKSQKTVLERKALPTFPLLLELNQKNLWTLHENVETSVDGLLRQKPFASQSRWMVDAKRMAIGHGQKTQDPHPFQDGFGWKPKKKDPDLLAFPSIGQALFQKGKKPLLPWPTFAPKALSSPIYLYALFFSTPSAQGFFQGLPPSIKMTKVKSQADVIFVSKLALQKNLALQELAMTKKLPVYLVQQESRGQGKKMLYHLQKGWF